MRSFAVTVLGGALVAAASAACASSQEADPPLPLNEAAAARELTFHSTPRIKRRDADAYREDKRDEARSVSDEAWEESLASYGRLGFFRAGDDPRKAAGDSASLADAFYTPGTNSITLLGQPPRSVVVHELVHALQDQFFDLRALTGAARTLDESAALAALVEGDATLAQIRFDKGGQEAATFVRRGYGGDAPWKHASNILLEAGSQPPFFYARWAFAYTFGTAYVAARAGIFDPSVPSRWNLAAVNAAYTAKRPTTTRAILAPDVDGTPAPVGLGAIPPELATSLEVASVDRIGAWYATVLMWRAKPDLAPSLASAWRGDQLVVLRERDASLPPRPNRRTGLVWTSQWADDDGAHLAAQMLAWVHRMGFTANDTSAATVGADGESLYLRRRGSRLVFARNLSGEEIRAVERALDGPPAAPLPPAAPAGAWRAFDVR